MCPGEGKNLIPNPISQVGNSAIRFVQELGGLAAFTVDIARATLAPPLRFAAFVREIYKLGVLSLLIICVCGLAVGMVLGLQGHHTLVRFGAQRSLGALVGLSLIRELGPVLTALLVAGRAGSATTAEIGAMVTTEQLNGLRMLSIDPVSLVIKPKAAAMLFVNPLLTALFIVCGLYGGYLIGVTLLGGDPGSYMASLRSAVDFHDDIECCGLKSLVFGLLLGVISTYRGYTSAPTAEGVSAATTSSVVISSVTVLLTDYVITALWGI
jgi:phospholipid/cholesterol/gamma-HCH transport system permease protein